MWSIFFLFQGLVLVSVSRRAMTIVIIQRVEIIVLHVLVIVGTDRFVHIYALIIVLDMVEGTVLVVLEHVLESVCLDVMLVVLVVAVDFNILMMLYINWRILAWVKWLNLKR